MRVKTFGILLGLTFSMASIASGQYTLLWSLPTTEVNLPGSGFQDGYLGDVDGDGRPELVGVGSSYYTLVIVDPLTGQPEFTYTHSSQITNVALVDLDVDGTPEIVFGDYTGQAPYPKWHILGVIDWTGPPANVPDQNDSGPRASFEEPIPNPASDAITLRFTLSKQATVGVRVLDVQGRSVSEIPASRFSPGANSFDVRLVREDNSSVPAGVYFLEYTVDERVWGVTRTVVLR